MNRARIRALTIGIVVGLLLPVLAGSARAADDDKAALREKALALNDVTGEDPILGKIKALIGDAEGTKKLLTVALGMAKDKNQPFNYNAAWILARSAHLLKETTTSETFYKLCSDLALKLQSGKKLADAYLGLITLYAGDKKFKEAEKLCREFLEMDDENLTRQKVDILERMIVVIAKQGKYEEAYKIIERLLKASPENWYTLELKAEVQREEGKYDESAKTYEEMLSRCIKDERLEKDEKDKMARIIRYTLSGVYVDNKEIDKAADHLKTLLADEPDNPTYNNDLGYIWADNDKNLDESEKLIRKALEEDRKQRHKGNADLKPEDDKDNSAYVDSLGWVLYKQKKYKEAKKYLLEAVKDKDAQHIEIYDHLADVHMVLGEKAEAIAAWKKGLELVGDNKREKERKVEVEKKLKAQESSKP